MGIQVLIITKSSWERWNLSDGLKDVGYLHEEGVWWAGDYQEQGAWSLWVNVGPSFGSLIDFCGHSDLPPSGFPFVRTERAGSAQLSVPRSDRRTVQHEGQVFFTQKAQEVYFPNLGSTCFPCFNSMRLDPRRDLASLWVKGAFWERL